MGVTVIEGYGLTETSPVVAVNRMSDGSIPGSVGSILPNVELKIVDESGSTVMNGQVGEILVRGKTVMNGYWNRITETKEIIQKLIKDEFPEPGSARNRKSNAPEKGKTTLLGIKNA